MVFLTSCTKQPTAQFSIINSGSTFDVGETIVLYNTSEDAKSYSWNFGDGSTSSSSSPDHSYSSSGSYTITLTAINKSKEDTYSQTITIRETKGEVIFCSDFSGPPIEVYLSSSYRGTITAIESGYPDCGDAGNVTISDLNPGTYSFYADETSDPYRHWSGYVDIEAGVCFKMNLTTSKSGETEIQEINYGDDDKFESLVIGEKSK